MPPTLLAKADCLPRRRTTFVQRDLGYLARLPDYAISKKRPPLAGRPLLYSEAPRQSRVDHVGRVKVSGPTRSLARRPGFRRLRISFR
jgi:hypothetical protein